MTLRFRSLAAVALALGTVLGASALDAPAARPSPREALGMLKAGNDRFARSGSTPVPLGANHRRALVDGQHPVAMVLSCADSRVPPEHVFNTGLGDLFVIRTAGEVIDRSVLATIEYGVEHLRVPLLVVMGHESCGAVAAAADPSAGGSASMKYLLDAIRAARKQSPETRDDIRGLVLANVEQVINDALAGSPLLQQALDGGEVAVVGAYYELVSGRVMFSEPVRTETVAGREPR